MKHVISYKLQNTREQHEETYGYNYHKNVKLEGIADFYDKIINETKIIIIDRSNIIGELNKVMQKSRGEIKLVRIIEVKIIIEGRNIKNIIDMYFKSGCMPILWKNFYGRDKKKRRCLYNKHVNRNEKHC